MPSPSGVSASFLTKCAKHFMWYRLILAQSSRRFGILAMVRTRVVRRPHPGLGIRAQADVARDHQRRYARDVALERERLQIEVQLDVLVERLRDPERHVHGRRLTGDLRRDLQPALHLADRLEVIVQARTVARRQPRPQAGDLRRHRVENAVAGGAARVPLVRRAAVAVEALEHELRVDLVRQRLVRRRPRHRVRVGAAVSPAADAGVGAGVLDGQLDRRQQRVLPVLARHDLIDADAAVDIRTGGLLRARTR